MPSLFPGMDPYLEGTEHWALFQSTFVGCLGEALLPGLPLRYGVRHCERQYGIEGEHREEYVEIVQKSDDKLMTLLDVVSPTNKTTAAGGEAYLSTRRRAKDAGAGLVEIDLVLQGRPMLEYSREGLPAWDYAVTVARATHPERYEIYLTTLQKRLPRFRVPLARDDRDQVLDLQSAFRRCYDQAGFADRVNYRETPAFLHDRIAVAAYQLWRQEGCPQGRDKEHWYAAVEQLSRPPNVG